jgi:crossover junction endodeoxyribonuclease RuvC
MIVVAVDPGLTGACAVLDQNGLRAVFDLPTMPIPGAGPKAMVRKKVDARALLKTLRQHCPAGEPVHSVVEAVSTMGGKDNAVQTQGSLLRSLGAIETVLECLGWAPQYVYPQAWKRHFGLIDSALKPAARKAKALECARRLYPSCTDIARAKDHNRAESILLAHHFRQVNA